MTRISPPGQKKKPDKLVREQNDVAADCLIDSQQAPQAATKFMNSKFIHRYGLGWPCCYGVHISTLILHFGELGEGMRAGRHRTPSNFVSQQCTVKPRRYPTSFSIGWYLWLRLSAWNSWIEWREETTGDKRSCNKPPKRAKRQATRVHICSPFDECIPFICICQRKWVRGMKRIRIFTTNHLSRVRCTRFLAPGTGSGETYRALSVDGKKYYKADILDWLAPRRSGISWLAFVSLGCA